MSCDDETENIKLKAAGVYNQLGCKNAELKQKKTSEIIVVTKV